MQKRNKNKSYSGKQYFNSELDKFSVVLLALLAFECRFQDFELVLLILERFSVELCTRKKEEKKNQRKRYTHSLPIRNGDKSLV